MSALSKDDKARYNQLMDEAKMLRCWAATRRGQEPIAASRKEREAEKLEARALRLLAGVKG